MHAPLHIAQWGRSRERWPIRVTEARLEESDPAGWDVFRDKRFTPPVLMVYTACTGLELLSCEILGKSSCCCWRSSTECTQNTVMSCIMPEKEWVKTLVRLLPSLWPWTLSMHLPGRRTLVCNRKKEYRQRDQMPEVVMPAALASILMPSFDH